MRQVLQNLIDGQPIDAKIDMAPTFRLVAIRTVAGSLRKRGLVTMDSSMNYTITPQGREALEQHKRATQ
jgi:predicted transcriptional regulator